MTGFRLGLYSMLAAILLLEPARAEAVVAARTLQVGHVLSHADLVVTDKRFAGAVTNIDAVVGLEVARTLYASRPVRSTDLREPALVTRNQLIRLVYSNRGLSIATMGRALERAAEGALIPVLNLSSKKTVHGVVRADGSVAVEGF